MASLARSIRGRIVQSLSFEKSLGVSRRFEERSKSLQYFCSYDKYKSLRDELVSSNNSFSADVLLENGKVLSFCGEMDKAKKHLKKIFCHGDLTTIDSVLYDVFLELALGKSLIEVKKIQFREVENYLRDLNHQLSFRYDLLNLPSFDNFKEGLIEQMLVSDFTMSKENKEANIAGTIFDDLTLVKKLGVLENFIYHRVSPYLTEWNLSFDLIYFEEDKLVGSLKGALHKERMVGKSFASFLQSILKKNLGIKKLSVFLE